MTVKEFNSLADGTAVWFRPPYFAFAMPATVRITGERHGLWVNFYGDGQCMFVPQEGREARFADWIHSANARRTLTKKTKQL